MSDLRPKGTKLTLGGKEYGLRFTLNAIDDIQDHFDVAIEELPKLFDEPKTRIKNIRYLITALINEDIACVNDETGGNAPLLDERYIGRQIDARNMGDIMTAIYACFADGTPRKDEDEIPLAASV